MKAFVYKTSKWKRDGKVMEFENLEACVNALLAQENFGQDVPELVISKIDSLVPDNGKECDYQIEIYDTWRE